MRPCLKTPSNQLLVHSSWMNKWCLTSINLQLATILLSQLEVLPRDSTSVSLTQCQPRLLSDADIIKGLNQSPGTEPVDLLLLHPGFKAAIRMMDLIGCGTRTGEHGSVPFLTLCAGGFTTAGATASTQSRWVYTHLHTHNPYTVWTRY